MPKRVFSRYQSDARVIIKACESLSFKYELSDEWLWLPGAAYGLSESVVSGIIAVDQCSNADLHDLDACMLELLDAPVPADNSPNPLISRIMHWYCELQRNVRVPVLDEPYVESLSADNDSDLPRYRVALPGQTRNASLRTLSWITTLVSRSQLVSGVEGGLDPKVIETEFENLNQLLRKSAAPGTNSIHFLRAAHQLDIPFRMMLRGVYVYGTGCYSRWLNSSITDQTSALGVGIAKSKQRSAKLLHQAGLPVPKHALVSSKQEALEIANKLGYPVVVKPDDEDQGRGVSSELSNPESVKKAYVLARELSADVLVEKFCVGEDYRVTVFRDEVIKTMHRRAGGVVGDGVSDVAELLSQEQKEPYLDNYYKQTGVMNLTMDDEALRMLAEQGLDVDSVPEKNTFVNLRKKRNISSGAKQTLITADQIHPDNIRLCIGAARALHLDFAGVDLIIPDISESWLASGGTILEVNAQPQVGISVQPETYATVLSQYLPPPVRIPVHLVLCEEGIIPDQEEIDDLADSLKCNGISSIEGVWIDGHQITEKTNNGFRSARILIYNPTVRAALCVMSAEEVVGKGLPTDRINSVICKNHAKSEKPGSRQFDRALSMLERNRVPESALPVSAELEGTRA